MVSIVPVDLARSLAGAGRRHCPRRFDWTSSAREALLWAVDEVLVTDQGFVWDGATMAVPLGTGDREGDRREAAPSSKGGSPPT